MAKQKIVKQTKKKGKLFKDLEPGEWYVTIEGVDAAMLFMKLHTPMFHEGDDEEEVAACTAVSWEGRCYYHKDVNRVYPVTFVAADSMIAGTVTYKLDD